MRRRKKKNNEALIPGFNWNIENVLLLSDFLSSWIVDLLSYSSNPKYPISQAWKFIRWVQSLLK